MRIVATTVWVLLLSSGALAQSRVVRVDLIGPDAAATQLSQSVAAVARPFDVTLRFPPIPVIEREHVVSTEADDDVFVGRVWIDLTRDGRADVFIANGDRSQVLIRQVPMGSANDAVGREEIAEIVASSLDALTHGQDFGVSASEARELLDLPPIEAAVAATPLPATPPPSWMVRKGWTPGLHYGARLGGSRRFEHGPQLSLAWEAQLIFLIISAGLEGSFTVPFTEGSAPVEIALRGGAVRVFTEWQLGMSERLFLGARLAMGIETIRVDPAVAQSRVLRRGDTQRDVLPVIQILGTLSVIITDWLALDLGLGADFALRDLRYRVEDPDGNRTVYSHRVIRPAGVIGFRFRP